MKAFWVGAVALMTLSPLAQAADEAARVLVEKMDNASHQLSYEISYIHVRKSSIQPLRYRHALIDGESFGHINYLSGPNRKIIRRGSEVSYYEPGVESFTIESGQMVAPLPAIIQSDIKRIAKLYNFVSLGRGREAGLSANLVRVSPKDESRYSYVLWIEDRSHLLLRADVLDRDGEPLEQYRVTSLVISSQVADSLKAIASAELPPVVHAPKHQDVEMGWEVTSLPKGFVPVYRNRHRLMLTSRPVESQMFSDGLFSFSVYLADADKMSVREQKVRLGRRTMHSFVTGNAEITVVGDIPPATAKIIAESVRFVPTDSDQGK
ncbi:sigma-E factor regulatory protein RseB [Veronia nyctiphanis]|uniref:Sigma-E factor regulatory protein RseB n=1 Tax=Veronia nyctiphanis TaxID=1278244 RepID=A0A4Q0YQK6_9GAMM|nr:sigma-E factor regulatory protein RseB [Veronia nyctiphanis]RXJ72334.1 sigma-E factor regulatory protein RseB [Veronia nyctiphanis]